MERLSLAVREAIIRAWHYQMPLSDIARALGVPREKVDAEVRAYVDRNLRAWLKRKGKR